MERRYNLIDQLIQEAKAYQSREQIEDLARRNFLKNVPIQPLYWGLREMSPEQLSRYLPDLSREQRESFLDIALWNRDDLDISEFEFWLEVYSHVPSLDLQWEFVASEQFALYFKGAFNLSTFDDEDPQDCNHENFFLTDDRLLLVEYGESFKYGNQLQSLLRTFYSQLGVEKAYTHLFKIVVDSFSILQEDEYRLKKNRLQDYGMIDYFEALEMLAPMTTMSQVDSFVQTPLRATGEIRPKQRHQILPKQTLNAYEKELGPVHEELGKIKNQKRIDFLYFNFLKLVNATLSVEDAFKKKTLAMTEVGRQTRHFLLLGLSYLKSMRSFVDVHVFDVFHFVEVFRIGKSLVHIHQNMLKKSMAHNGFQSPRQEAFMGRHLQTIWETSFKNPVQLIRSTDKVPLDILDRQSFDEWSREIKRFVDLLPFISQFNKSYENMLEQGLVRDEHYLNYNASDIDFEALILSSFINFDLGYYKKENHRPKMGLSVADMKAFGKKYFDQNHHLYSLSDLLLRQGLKAFLNSFALGKVVGITEYLYLLLDDHLSGYDFAELSDDQWPYVGGPIILVCE